jgi:hypothetical protein
LTSSGGILGSPTDLLPATALAPLSVRPDGNEFLRGLGQVGSMVDLPPQGCLLVVPGDTLRCPGPEPPFNLGCLFVRGEGG